MKKIYLGIIIGIILVVLLIFLLTFVIKEKKVITNFQECVQAGNSIMESYPEKCMANGKVFVNEEQTKISDDFFSCDSDADCIPLPSDCHPTSCINKEYESYFQRPEACTMIFMIEAAYSQEDCLCQNNICVNKNLGRVNID